MTPEPGTGEPLRSFWISAPTIEAFATRVTTLLGEYAEPTDEIHLERTVRPTLPGEDPVERPGGEPGGLHEGTLFLRAH